MNADLAITKDDGATSSTPGTQIVYSIVASNAGPDDVPNTVVEDLFPAALSCTWTCAASTGSSCTANGSGDINDIVTILAGGDVTFTATCDIDATATGSLSNTATVAADAPIIDPDLGNNSATDSNTLEPSADLAISKTDNQAEHTPGTPIDYVIVVENLGPSAVSDAVVDDTFQAPLQNCSWTSAATGGASGNSDASGDLSDTLDMPVGSTVTYDVSCDVDPSATGSLSNTASIASATVSDPEPGNDSATDTSTLVPSADLSISKTDNQTEHTPGTPINYIIVAENIGPSAVSDAVVTDTFQAPLQNCSWTSAATGGASGNSDASGDLSDTLDMPVGSTVTYDVNCDVDASATGSVSNTASIASATIPDPEPGNDSATDTSSLEASADLSVSKSNEVDSVTPGEQVSYTVLVQNAGPSVVDDAVVSDSFPAELENCSWTSVAAGGATGNTDGSGDLGDTLDMPVDSSVTYEITCDVQASASGSVSNTATIASASVTDPEPGNDSSTETDTVQPSADLTISKTDNTTEHLPGTPINYVIVVENLGPSAVSDAEVTDQFQAPLENCSWTSTASGGATGNSSADGDLNDTLDLPVDSSVTYDIVCDVSPFASGTLSNTATISSPSATDPVPGDNSATDGDTMLFAPIAVPTLGSWMILVMAGLLALFGFVNIRRRLN
ncbi:IPTL-CTERM sorting domain-containing protein [Wenzhouxiangella sp. EGI_FJ10409]|uniref:IPTL-CTERM sorting domain-containing protein n=1 Tax=Wenzhouxiangella sp. EGI_FJ10409 TaxID=3243767 RepID=UPI0035DAE692